MIPVCVNTNGLTRRQWVNTPSMEITLSHSLVVVLREREGQELPYPEGKPVHCTRFLCILEAVMLNPKGLSLWEFFF